MVHCLNSFWMPGADSRRSSISLAILYQTSPATIDWQPSTSSRVRSIYRFVSPTVMDSRAVPGRVCRSPDLHRMASDASPARSSSSRTCAAIFSLPMSNAVSDNYASFRYKSRNNARYQVLLDDDDHHQRQGQDHAVYESTCQHCAFLTFEIGDRHAGGNVLR
jgi:hypothetical protein